MSARYGTSPVKRPRRSRAEMEEVRDAIYAALEEDHPQIVRQVFYQLVVRGVIEKTETEYSHTVSPLLVKMRLADEVPWAWVVDDSRRTRQTQTFDSVRDALNQTAKFYRRSVLDRSDVYIEVWCEKDGLASVIWEEASEFDVPVIASRGLPSLTQVYTSFENIRAAAEVGKQSYVYQFGDHDPSGCLIPKVIERRLDEFCEKHDCQPPIVERVALTPEQIERYGLPSRPTKRAGNPHAKGFRGRSTELDALPSRELRRLVRSCIEQHISPRELDALRVAEDLSAS